MGRPTKIALFALAAFVASPSAHAQCGAATSSCRQCHEIEGLGPRPAGAKWHVDHALGDFCADCHGGDGTTRDEATAHAGLVDPLALPPARCVACHADAASRVGTYVLEGSRPRHADATVPPSFPKPPNDGGGGPRRVNTILAAVIVALGLGGGTYAWQNERVGRERRRLSLRSALEAREWSPYVAGALLGVVAAVSMAIFGHRLSGGGAYQQMAAPVGRALAHGSVYFNRVLPGAARWELSGLTGALLGAFASARLGGSFRFRTMPDSGWTEVFGPSVAKRWAIGFAGAALTEIAAGIAGGCTASLAVSGGAALAPGAFAFMAAMFVGGIPTAWVLYRRGRS
jgi:hypothetical protein